MNCFKPQKSYSLKKIVKVYSLLFLSLISIDFVSAQADWKIRKNENGILVYTRDIPGSDFKEIKTTTNFKTNLSSLVGLLTDVQSHPLWIYQCKQSKLIKTINSSEYYCYMETMVPWPASNRDGVIRFKFSQDSVTKVVTVTSQNMLNVLPEIDGIVRVHKAKAQWTFIPKDDGTVDGEYQLNVDPGGSVPAWIINMFVVEGPYESLTNMKKLLDKNKYNDAKFDFIKN